MNKYQISQESYDKVRAFTIQRFNPDSDIFAIASTQSGVVLATDDNSILGTFQEEFSLSEIHPNVYMAMLTSGQIDGPMMGNNQAIHSLTNQTLRM